MVLDSVDGFACLVVGLDIMVVWWSVMGLCYLLWLRLVCMVWCGRLCWAFCCICIY